jgi:hypothetical protein
MHDSWESEFAWHLPAFAPLLACAGELRGGSFPGCDELNRLLAGRDPPVLNASGRPLRFVAQAARQSAFEDKYEPRIFLRGEVQFRRANWHDLFNALVWLAFPHTKAALNARQFHALERQRAAGARNRGALQDALTLFDEGGVIVATSDLALYELLAGHAWKDLFWQRRAEVAAQMRFHLFGHALYEKMLQPFVGVTGRGIACPVAADFFALPPARQLHALDRQLAGRFADPALSLAARELAPVPLLGIPGWCTDNAREDYYDNTAYFRPGPGAAPARLAGGADAVVAAPVDRT